MKEYVFDYTKQATASLILLLSFGVFGLSAFVLSYLLRSVLIFDIILSIALGVVYFLFNKHRIKSSGNANLAETSVTFELSAVKHIAFSELKYYYIYHGKNGTTFTLGLLDGTKLKIGANNNFCDNERINAFLVDLQLVIEQYKTKNQVNIIHLESILARKNTIYILTFFTLLTILGFIFTKMPVMIISIGLTLPIIFNWIQYFQLKQNNKLVDF